MCISNKRVVLSWLIRLFGCCIAIWATICNRTANAIERYPRVNPGGGLVYYAAQRPYRIGCTSTADVPCLLPFGVIGEHTPYSGSAVWSPYCATFSNFNSLDEGKGAQLYAQTGLGVNALGYGYYGTCVKGVGIIGPQRLLINWFNAIGVPSGSKYLRLCDSAISSGYGQSGFLYFKSGYAYSHLPIGYFEPCGSSNQMSAMCPGSSCQIIDVGCPTGEYVRFSTNTTTDVESNYYQDVCCNTNVSPEDLIFKPTNLDGLSVSQYACHIGDSINYESNAGTWHYTPDCPIVNSNAVFNDYEFAPSNNYKDADFYYPR